MIHRFVAKTLSLLAFLSSAMFAHGVDIKLDTNAAYDVQIVYGGFFSERPKTLKELMAERYILLEYSGVRIDSKQWKDLASALGDCSEATESKAFDATWAFLIKDRKGKEVVICYTDAWCKKGILNAKPVVFGTMLGQWIKDVLTVPFELKNSALWVESDSSSHEVIDLHHAQPKASGEEVTWLKMSDVKDDFRVRLKTASKVKKESFRPAPIRSREEAFLHLNNNVSMARWPSVAVEEKLYYYFSGGTGSRPVTDFSTGFGVHKETGEIVTW